MSDKVNIKLSKPQQIVLWVLSLPVMIVGMVGSFMVGTAVVVVGTVLVIAILVLFAALLVACLPLLVLVGWFGWGKE